MTKQLVLITICCASYTATTDADTPYRWKRSVEPEVSQEELVSVGLDTEIYKETLPSLYDLRLQTSTGETVPFLIQQRLAETQRDARKSWRVRDPHLTPIQGTGLRIEFEIADDDPAPDGLTIITPIKNFEKSIQVFAITTDGVESQIAERNLIYDYSQFMDVRQLNIPLSETTARRFRIEIAGLTTEQESQLTILKNELNDDAEVLRETISAVLKRPFRIDRIELWAEYEESLREIITDHPYPAQSVLSHIDDETGNTVIDLKTMGEPINAFRFESASRNFQRRVLIQSVDWVDEQERLTSLVQTKIHRFDFRELQDENLTIHVPTNRRRHYRIEITNGDNPPLENLSVTPLGSVDEIVFIAESDQTYELLYGSPDAKRPDLDTAAIQASLKEAGSPVPLSLGKATDLGPMTVTQESVTFKDLLNNPFVLSGLAVVMIIALTIALYSAAKKIDSVADGDPSN